MLEDGIQYICTRNVPAGAESLASRILPSPNITKPVTGIVLHVEPNSGVPACNMTFLRSQTSAVTIGRKSSSDPKSGRSDEDLSTAGFACQVVSGKHAKLAFSDSGYVYLIDLRSRHGTHILHPGDTVSKMLDPEVVTMLCDGDIITFGKTVGKGSYLVPPVTARVELLYGETPERTVSKAGRASISAAISAATGRLNSGRYGLFLPSSLSSGGGSSPSSDDDSSSRYDRDSDVEEITPPSSSQDCGPHGHSLSKPMCLPAMPALRSLVQSSGYGALGLPFSFDLDNLRLPPLDRPVSERSRSNSPMDLASPTPTPPVDWALDVESSPPPDDTFEVLLTCPSGSDKNALNQEVEDIEEGSAEMSLSAADLHFRAVSESRAPVPVMPVRLSESRSPSPPSEFNLQGREKETLDKMLDVNETIRAMQRGIAESIAKGQSRVKYVGQDDDELDKLHDRVTEAEFASIGLDDRLDTAEENVFSLREHVDKLQQQADALSAPEMQNATAEALAEVRSGIKALSALVAEMRILHEESEKQMTTKIASLEAAREALASATSEAQAVVSLKRKRDDDDKAESEAAPITTFDTVAIQATGQPQDLVVRPMRKRAKRVVKSVVHTATAMTVGAIVTWSALAFS